MLRMYFLAPDVETTSSIVNELLEFGLEDHQIHVIGNDHDKIEKAHLHEAGILENSDLLPAIRRGLLYGGTTGFLAGIAFVTFPPAGLVLGGAAVLSASAFGAGFGAWISSMIGVSVKDLGVEHFEQAVKKGHYLMLVDVDKDLFEQVEKMVHAHHPEVDIQWVDLKGRNLHYASSM